VLRQIPRHVAAQQLDAPPGTGLGFEQRRGSRAAARSSQARATSASMLARRSASSAARAALSASAASTLRRTRPHRSSSHDASKPAWYCV
jgi:hypothetical protein